MAMIRSAMRILRSTSNDVHANLALEERLLDTCGDEATLLFTVNAPSVVVGKNQVPWRELNLPELRRRGIPVARRLSGGGAVYHDRGNLNYTLVLARDRYRSDDVFGGVIAGLAACGARAQIAQRTNLFVGDRKVSGSAFAFRRHAALHHGTLLVDADLSALGRLLEPSLPEVDSHAVKSRPAQTANLSALTPGLTMDGLTKALAASLAGVVHESTRDPEEVDPAAVVSQDGLARYRSWEWIFGQTPRFSVRIPGALEVVVDVADGVMTRATVQGCAVPGAVGLRFERSTLIELLVREGLASTDLPTSWPDF